jgi:predicted DNA-binding protein
MKNFHIAGKIPQPHYIALMDIQNATGQTQSEILREAIAVYLKKSKAPILKSRLDAIEEKISKLAALIIK